MMPYFMYILQYEEVKRKREAVYFLCCHTVLGRGSRFGTIVGGGGGGVLHPVGRRSCNNSWLRQGDNALGGKVPTKQGHHIVANVGGLCDSGIY
jgi:hypothetical protein